MWALLAPPASCLEKVRQLSATREVQIMRIKANKLRVVKKEVGSAWVYDDTVEHDRRSSECPQNHR